MNKLSNHKELDFCMYSINSFIYGFLEPRRPKNFKTFAANLKDYPLESATFKIPKYPLAN